jgi:Mn2+/Fe2+ NRAMP family transporter
MTPPDGKASREAAAGTTTGRMSQGESIRIPSAVGAGIPVSFWGHVKSFGPGIVVVLTWLGAGDLVDCAVAGANYGYALMWGLALALFARFAMVNIIAKFQLMNPNGYTILQGYGAVHRAYPLLLGFGAVLYGHMSTAYCLSGAANALFEITGIGSALLWGAISLVLAVLITGRAIYRHLELVQKIILALMTLVLLASVAMVRPDALHIAKGLFALELPPKMGSFSAALVVVSLVGAVGGSIANLLYPLWMKQKGYIRPEHRRVQTFDLLFAVTVMVVLNLSVWVIGAEVLHPKGLTIGNVRDLARLLGEVAGRGGEVLIYLAVWAACFSTVIGGSDGYLRLAMDGLYTAHPGRNARFQGNHTRDPLFKVLYFVVVLLPMLWVLPGMPGFVPLTVVANAALVLFLPLISIGLLFMINKRSLMGTFAHNIWDNLLLGTLTLLSLGGAFHIAAEFAKKVTGP